MQTTRLMSPKDAKLKFPSRADTGAYSWRSAPGAPSVAAAGAKGAPRLVKRNRFGDGKKYRSGPNMRRQPPVLRSTRFVVFGRTAPHPPGGSAAVITSGSGPGDLPVKVDTSHPQWVGVLDGARAAWAAGAGKMLLKWWPTKCQNVSFVGPQHVVHSLSRAFPLLVLKNLHQAGQLDLC